MTQTIFHNVTQLREPVHMNTWQCHLMKNNAAQLFGMDVVLSFTQVTMRHGSTEQECNAT